MFETNHITVYRRDGTFAGWPANHGLWKVGNRILVGFETGKMDLEARFHAIDRSSPVVPMIAETKDNGATWDCWHPTGPVELRQDHGPMHQGQLDQIKSELRQLIEPIDFHQQLVKFRMTGINEGPSYMCVTQEDDCYKTWDGPYELPMFYRIGVSARTSYLTDPTDKHRCIAFWSASKQSDGREGQPFCVETLDGGISWSLPRWIDYPPDRGFGIMPSVVRLDGDRVLCAVRWRELFESKMYAGYERFGSGIICYESIDDCHTWLKISVPIRGMPKAGNPPDLVKLADDRVFLVYGWRARPYGIVAQETRDGGHTWLDPIWLRQNGGCHDLGYSRSVLCDDGDILTAYYWCDSPDEDRYIAATKWGA